MQSVNAVSVMCVGMQGGAKGRGVGRLAGWGVESVYGAGGVERLDGWGVGSVHGVGV